MTTAASNQPVIRIVDDDQDFLDGLSFMLEAKGWQIAAYRSPVEFLCSDTPSIPGCLLLDIRMPEMSGIELQSEMSRRGISLPIIIMTGHADVESAVRTLKMGAVDFLQKPLDSQELFDSISQAVALSEIRALGGLDADSAKAIVRAFSAREKQVCDLLCQGLENSAIAQRLGLTNKTVQNYRNTIYGKLRVHNTTELLKILNLLRDPGV